MSFNHTFKTQVNWQLQNKETTINPKSFSRNHTVTIANKKAPLELSAAKPFRGDDTLYNPEDLLVSALASCHMMAYLFLCAQHGIAVLNYEDNAEATSNVEATWRGQVTKVILNPVVTIADASTKARAKTLHTEANSLCFIANSCNFPVEHNVKIVIQAS